MNDITKPNPESLIPMASPTEKPNPVFRMVPKNMEEAAKWADYLSKSQLVPKDFQGKPRDILIAMQMGAELNLPALQAIQGIAVINGRPSIWGDLLVALVQIHADFEYKKEYFEGEKEELTAVCEVKRKDWPVHISKFSVEDAKTAKLWTRSPPSPWALYPKRMLQTRARSFGLRDCFADILKGLYIAEEVSDYPVTEKDITPAQKAISVSEVELSETEKKAADIRSKI